MTRNYEAKIMVLSGKGIRQLKVALLLGLLRFCDLPNERYSTEGKEAVGPATPTKAILVLDSGDESYMHVVDPIDSIFRVHLYNFVFQA